MNKIKTLALLSLTFLSIGCSDSNSLTVTKFDPADKTEFSTIPSSIQITFDTDNATKTNWYRIFDDNDPNTPVDSTTLSITGTCDTLPTIVAGTQDTNPITVGLTGGSCGTGQTFTVNLNLAKACLMEPTAVDLYNVITGNGGNDPDTLASDFHDRGAASPDVLRDYTNLYVDLRVDRAEEPDELSTYGITNDAPTSCITGTGPVTATYTQKQTISAACKALNSRTDLLTFNNDTATISGFNVGEKVTVTYSSVVGTMTVNTFHAYWHGSTDTDIVPTTGGVASAATSSAVASPTGETTLVANVSGGSSMENSYHDWNVSYTCTAAN